MEASAAVGTCNWVSRFGVTRRYTSDPWCGEEGDDEGFRECGDEDELGC